MIDQALYVWEVFSTTPLIWGAVVGFFALGAALSGISYAADVMERREFDRIAAKLDEVEAREIAEFEAKIEREAREEESQNSFKTPCDRS